MSLSKISKSLSEVESSHCTYCTWYFKTAICYTSVLLNATNQFVEETVTLLFLNNCVFHFFHNNTVKFWTNFIETKIVRIQFWSTWMIPILIRIIFFVSKKVEFFAFLSFCKRMLWKISQISWLVKISTLLSAGNHRRFCFSFT